MKKYDALPGGYLAKEHFPQPTLVTVHSVVMEEVKSDNGPDKKKPVLYLEKSSNPKLDTSRGIILNVGNWDACETITGQPDSDDWVGAQIVVFVDPDVMYAGKKVGGLRIRAKNPTAQPAEDPVPASDVPF
ncbi:MAG: hypothetical protein ABUJ98_14550 [Hyphomicrobium sp.]